MSEGPTAAYRVRPNKALDRELFLSLLSRLDGALNLSTYRYIGLGGAFMEDFRLLHTRLGVRDMVCVEEKKATHLRQRFNKPAPSIECRHERLEQYLLSAEFEAPVIAWLDFTQPSSLRSQVELFAHLAQTLPVRSILRITVNAEPSSLPARAGLVEEEMREARLAEFQNRMGELAPAGLEARSMQRKRFGLTVLSAVRLAVERLMLELPGRRAVWALSTVYADGQQMATATLVAVEDGDDAAQRALEAWEFWSEPESALVIDMPALTALERLTLEAHDDPRAALGFELPRCSLGSDPIESFKRFRRFIPHFSRIEL